MSKVAEHKLTYRICFGMIIVYSDNNRHENRWKIVCFVKRICGAVVFMEKWLMSENCVLKFRKI